MNGLTIQWGMVTCSNGSASVSGLMFTSGETYKIFTIGYYNSSPEKVGIKNNSKTATSCTLGSDYSGSFSLEWLAIGYQNGLTIQWNSVSSVAYQLIKIPLFINYTNTNYVAVPIQETTETGEYNANVYINKKEANGVTVHCQRYKTTILTIGY